MSDYIVTYLERLRGALAGCDPAVIQDALSDAEEHLRTALDQLLEDEPEIPEAAALERIVKKYGTPEETAAAYRELEERIRPVLAEPVRRKKEPPRSRFLGVLVDPRSYAALFYLIFSYITGVFYFCWAMIGMSLSLGLMVLVIGIPFFGVFLFSLRGMALVEGRLVEALLGVRMPRRPVFSRPGISSWERFKFLLTDGMTWKIFGYMMMMLPLGILYFTIAIVLLSFSLWGILRPILEYGFDLPYMMINTTAYYSPHWFMPIAIITGFLLLIVTLHTVKGLGRIHGKIARAMLIQD